MLSREDARLPEPGNQVLLGAVALGPVAVAAEQLQVFDVVGAAAGLGEG